MDEHARDGDEPLRPAASGGGPTSTRCRVLIIDDDELSARTLALILEYEGYEVRTATDGESGLVEVARFRPDAVFSDLGLPGIDGYEVARRLREDRTLSAGIRLLATVTGHSELDHHRLSREAGFNHHLVKPIEPADILALLSEIEPGA